MGQRQRRWARNQSDKLKETLGGVCKKCGKITKLQFDIILPLGNNDHHRRMSWDTRIRFYKKQHAFNNLQLLCDSCNGRKKNTFVLNSLLKDTQPSCENEPF